MKITIHLLSRRAAENLKQYQLLRFVAVGVINTIFSYGIYSALLYLSIDFRLANLVALIIGILFSFKTQSSFVFFNRNNRLLGRFFIVWLGIYFINIGLIWYLMRLGLNPYSAGALAVPFSTGFSYLFQKRFVFLPLVAGCENRDG